VNESTSTRVWSLVTLRLTLAGEEFASALLFELGTTGIVTLEEDSRHVQLGAYFDDCADPRAISDAVAVAFADAGRADELLGTSIAAVADQDWMEKWKEGFEPGSVGDRLIIAPSWKLPTEEIAGREVIQIDPGMAFGTGTHETTRLCLQLLERYWNGGRLLDVGTGTGILSIAAALLQPDSRVVAIDVDPLAVQVARENVVTNRVSESVEVIDGQPRDFVGQGFDIAVANLTAEVIISLTAELSGCVKPGGLLILSGILNELRADVELRLEAAGFKVFERCEASEWSAIVAREE
jgi:ribosomal protein L11 methyltransferase